MLMNTAVNYLANKDTIKGIFKLLNRQYAPKQNIQNASLVLAIKTTESG